MAVNRSGAVTVRGLSELRKELRQLEDADRFKAELKDANFKVASVVGDIARPRMAGLGRMGARASQTIRSSRAATSARLSLGGPGAPYAEGVEFGAHSNVGRRVANPGGSGSHMRAGWNQFREWRGNGTSAGYAIFPTIRENTPLIVRLYEDEVGRITAAAFPD